MMVVLASAPAPVRAEGEAEVERIGLGVMLPMSGARTSIGHEMKNALLLGLEDINARGGINGRELYLDIRDTAGVTDHIKGIMSSFVKAKQHAVAIGVVDSDAARIAGQIADRGQIVYIASTAAAGDITRNSYRNTFRIAAPHSRHIEGLLGLLSKSRKIRRIAVIRERSVYSDILNEALETAAAAKGWKVAASVTFEAGELESAQAVQAVLAGSPDAVIVTAFGRDAAAVTGALKDAASGELVIAGTTKQFSSPEFAAALGERSENVLAASKWPTGLMDGRVRDFVVRYRETYGTEPGYHAAQAHAALTVAAIAMSRADIWSIQSVTRSLEESRFQTTYGLVDFVSDEEVTNQNVAPSYVVQWISGQPEIIWPDDSRTAEPVLPGISGGLTVMPGSTIQ
jgi:branched-chain amino acid transport system substrate-binding protein